MHPATVNSQHVKDEHISLHIMRTLNRDYDVTQIPSALTRPKNKRMLRKHGAHHYKQQH